MGKLLWKRMDMPGMDMMGMDSFLTVNSYIAKVFWILIATFVGIGLVSNILNRVEAYSRRKRQQNGHPSATKPQNAFWQMNATVRTIFREMSYPQLWTVKNPRLAMFTPPSLGKMIIIFLYWVTITAMLTSDSILADPNYYERIGYRAAWVTVSQMPLVIILAGRSNIIAWLTGSSYERLNWAHRWIARTMLCTVAVHFGFFFREWIKGEILQIELETMIMVRYGMAAAGILLWMNISGLPFFRSWFYEFFYLQHIASIGGFLYVLYMHVPSYAMYFVYFGIAMVSFDRLCRLLHIVWQNVSFTKRSIGYKAEIVAAPGDITRVTIEGVQFKWTPGQHVYLSIPRLGPFEAHPFTIGAACPTPESKMRKDIELQVLAHGGFTRRLLNFAKKHPNQKVQAFLQGPLGCYPQWDSFETLFLVSASTGSSFTLPILESILDNPGCVRQVYFTLLVQHRPQCSCAMARLRAAAKAASSRVKVHIQVAVTRGPLVADETSAFDACCCGGEGQCLCGAGEENESIEVLDDDSSLYATGTVRNDEKFRGDSSSDVSIVRSRSPSKQAAESGKGHVTHTSFLLKAATSTPIAMTARRPALDSALRHAVENAKGETCVAVCGGKVLSGHIRNVVASLSDERAVHKGTGAQGIQLHVEEFAF